jgi:hypothetical protein
MTWSGNKEAQRQADEAFAKLKASNNKKAVRTKKPVRKFVRPNYHGYMKSSRWKRVKERIYKLRGRKCELCGSEVNLHVHHLNYNRLGRERNSDLQILCSNCHATTHEDKGYFSELAQEFLAITSG